MNDRLSKLVLMLSSPADGEVVAAARAIGRLLQSQNMDWHDLARMIGTESNNIEQPYTPQAPKWKSAVEECLRHTDLLSEKEVSFLKSIRRRSSLTEKQAKWLRDILTSIRESA
jgi:hypothetical protein